VNKRFVIALDSHTEAQNLLLKEYINKGGYGWWHWINGFWLLTDPLGKLNAQELRRDLSEIYPSVRMMVLELQGSSDTWAGFGPNSAEKNMFDWMRDNWK